MKKSILIIPFIFLLTISAFSQTEPKPEGKAIVYVYSLGTTTTVIQVRKPMFLDDKEIADIRPERYYIVLIEPGKHILRFKSRKQGGVEMNFEAGKTYYLRVNWESDLSIKPAGLNVIQPEAATYDISQIKPIDEKNIKDKSIVVRELKIVNPIYTVEKPKN